MMLFFFAKRVLGNLNFARVFPHIHELKVLHAGRVGMKDTLFHCIAQTDHIVAEWQIHIPLLNKNKLQINRN